MQLYDTERYSINLHDLEILKSSFTHSQCVVCCMLPMPCHQQRLTTRKMFIELTDLVRKTVCLHFTLFGICKVVNLSPYRPWRPLGLRKFEAPTYSDIRLIDGGKVVSPKRWPLFTPQEDYWYLFLTESTQGP
jgi:hypothetical protein